MHHMHIQGQTNKKKPKKKKPIFFEMKIGPLFCKKSCKSLDEFSNKHLKCLLGFLSLISEKKNTAKEVRGENGEHWNFICFFHSPFIIIFRNSIGADNMQITCNWESQKQPKKYLKWQRSSWKKSCSFREQWRSFTTLIEVNWSYRRSAVFEKTGRKPK